MPVAASKDHRLVKAVVENAALAHGYAVSNVGVQGASARLTKGSTVLVVPSEAQHVGLKLTLTADNNHVLLGTFPIDDDSGVGFTAAM